jgi:molybdopterin synthase catalytic subunit
VAGLDREAIDPTSLLALARTDADGALASFVGVVRDSQDGHEVLSLEYEAHEPMAVREMERLAADAAGRWPIGRVLLRHRLGEVAVGDVSVVVVVAAPHRAEALEACRWLIDSLKAEVPIFKKEYFADGTSEWVGEGPGF